MRIGTSVVVMAIGAVLTFAVETDSTEGFNINTIGIILMVAGAIGLVWALLMTNRRSVAGTTVVEERPVRRVYEDPV